MKQILIFCISILFLACTSTDTTVIEQNDNPAINTLNSSPIDTFQLYRDSLALIENSSFNKDTLTYEKFFETRESYNVIYHQVGNTKTKDKAFSISINSLSEQRLLIRLLKKQNETWLQVDSTILLDLRFSPAFFNAHFDDYNKDGLNDIYLVLYNSMSVAYSYGQLIIISEQEEKLIPINTSLEIPNLFTNEGNIESVTFNHPGHETTKYKKTNFYIIEQNELILKDSKKEFL